VPPDRVLESVRNAYPDLCITSLQFPQTKRKTYRVNAGPVFKAKPGKSHNVHADPFTARIIGEQSGRIDFVGTIQLLHFDLLGGRNCERRIQCFPAGAGGHDCGRGIAKDLGLNGADLDEAALRRIENHLIDLKSQMIRMGCIRFPN